MSKFNWVVRPDGMYELHDVLGDGADRRVFLFTREQRHLFVRSTKRKTDILREKKERGEFIELAEITR